MPARMPLVNYVIPKTEFPFTQLHSPTQEGAEISTENPRCCCIPLASPWIVALRGGGEAPRAPALHLRCLSCSPVLWAVGQHCPRARVSFSIAAVPTQSSLQTIQGHPSSSDSSPGYGRAGPEPGCPCGTSCGATPLSQHCTPTQGHSGETLVSSLHRASSALHVLYPSSASHCCVDTNCHENHS